MFSDAVGAFEYMQNKVSKFAYPELIGRSIIASRFTKEPVETFPINSKAVAYNYAEGAVKRLSRKKNEVITVSTDILAEASEEVTIEFVQESFTVLAEVCKIRIIPLAFGTGRLLLCLVSTGKRNLFYRVHAPR